MQYDLRLRFSFVDDKICVDFQRYTERVAPSINRKSILLNAKLNSDGEKELLVFLQQIAGKYPPFVIPKELFCDALFEKIKNLNFYFIQKKNRSLKRIYKIPFEAKHCKINALQPTNIKIYIKNIVKNKISAESYFDFDGNEVPLRYNFLIVKKNTLFTMDTADIISKASVIVQNIFNDYFSFDEVNALKSEFDVLVKSSDGKRKSVSLSNTSTGFLSFDKDLEYRVDLYNNLLKSYLNGKNYVEFSDKVVFFKDMDLNEKSVLQIMQQSNIRSNNVVEFLEKIENINQYPCNSEIKKLEKKIKVSLKPYQIDGVLWLCNLYKNNLWGGLLADDMGLGKTLQTICFLVVNNISNILIIAPASLIQNWKNEILKFTYIEEKDISLNLQSAKIQILSYESIRKNFTKLHKYHTLILDESQKIKNNKTQVFSALNQIERDFTIIISGTPIENSLLDLWNMMGAVNINFKWLYENKISPFICNSKNAIHLSTKLLSHFIKRRTKDKVLDLPDRYNQTIFIDFSHDEKAVYNKIYKIFYTTLKSNLSVRANFVMLEGLLRLRQFCSLHNIIPVTIHNCKNLQDSKLNALLKLVNNITSRKEKVIIFSQFTKSLEILKMALNNIEFLYLDGSISKQNRAALVEKFQAKNSPFSVFLVSLKVGGVGLNLTNAQNAIILEPWFNPAVEEQAFSRIHRIGQNNNVHIYRLLYSNSIESQIDNLISNKLNLSRNLNDELLKLAKNIFDSMVAKK